MLKNADYIYNNVLKSDGALTTLDFCKKAQVGVDLSVKSIKYIMTPGLVLKEKTIAPRYADMLKVSCVVGDGSPTRKGWELQPGTYICELNEGIQLGGNDTGFIIGRSSLNRSGVTVMSAVWDPGFTTVDNSRVNTMSVRIIVDSDSCFIEENARVAQLIVADNSDTELYDGQWQGGRNESKLG